MRTLVRAWCVAALPVACGDPVVPGPAPPGNTHGSAPGGVGQLSTGTDGAGSDGSMGGTDTDFECGELELSIKVNDPNVVLVLDRSGSMAFPWDHDANPASPDSTRWESLRVATNLLIDEFEGEMQIGGTLFPWSMSPEGCGLPTALDVAISAGGGAQVASLLATPQAVPAGGTPTAAAIGLGAQALAAEPDSAMRIIVLVTDGLPSCGESIDTAINAAQAARSDHGVLTFAIGVGIEPGTIAAFQALAQAGGASEVFFNGTNQQELVDAMALVAGEATRCRIPLPEIPAKQSDLLVELDGSPLSAQETCGAGGGWAFPSTEGPLDTIEICASTCEALTDNSELVAIYACPPATPGP